MLLRHSRRLLPSSTSPSPVPASKPKAVLRNDPPKGKQAAGAVSNAANLVCKPRKRSAGIEALASPAKAPRQAVTGYAAAAPLFRSPPLKVSEQPMPFFKFDAAAHLIKREVISGPNILGKLHQVFDKCGFPLDIGFFTLRATSQHSTTFKCIVSSDGEVLGMASARSKREAKCLVFQEVWDRLENFSACSSGDSVVATGSTDEPTVHIRRKNRKKRRNPPKNLVRHVRHAKKRSPRQETKATVQDFASSSTSSSVTATEYGASLTRKLEGRQSTGVLAAGFEPRFFGKTLVPKQMVTKAAANTKNEK